MRNVVLVVLAVFFVWACDSTHHDHDWADLDLNEVSVPAQSSNPSHLKYSKKLSLQNGMQAEAVLDYSDDLTLIIDEKKVVIEKGWLEKTDALPEMDLMVMDQDARDWKIILVSAKHHNALELWAFEYYDTGDFRQIWKLPDDPIEISYSVSISGEELQLLNPSISMKLDLEPQQFVLIEQAGQKTGKIQLSAPLDILLDDIIYPGQSDLIVRREVIGDKPEWLPFDSFAFVYFAQRGHIKEARRYTLTGDILYSSKDLNPSLTVQQLLEEAKAGVIRIRLAANSKLDPSSLSKALSSTTSNVRGKHNFDPEVVWLSDMEVELSFHQLENREALFIDWHQVTNWLGRKYEVSNSSFIFQAVYEYAPYVVLYNRLENERIIYKVPEAIQMQLVNEGESSKSLLILNEDEHVVFSPLTGNFRTIPLSYPEGNTRFHVMYPDRIFKETNYVMESLKQLYRYDQQGNKTKIWELPEEEHRSIYGFSVSPDGEYISVLYSEDNSNGPTANLIILDQSGKQLAYIESAAYYSKSDGVIPYVNMEWIDQDTIVIPTNMYINHELTEGIRKVTFDSGKLIVEEPVEVESAGTHLIHKFGKGIWMRDHQTGDELFVGMGHFIGWIDEHHAVWYENYNHQSPLPGAVF